MVRPSWDEYFLRIAAVVASRSTCCRKQVGALLVKDNQILSTGYAGSIAGQPHCIDVGCEIEPGGVKCVRTVHAECNAILQAAMHGVSTQGATLYSTLSPCVDCFKMLANAGVIRIVYDEEYRLPPDEKLAQSCRISMVHERSPNRSD